MERIGATSPFKLIRRRYYLDASVDLTTKGEMYRYVRANCGTEYHPIGTVPPEREGEGAVNSRLRGRGVRVVDASVVPLHMSGNVVSAVYAVAANGCDLIKEGCG